MQSKYLHLYSDIITALPSSSTQLWLTCSVS